jgi:hypothetical protein
MVVLSLPLACGRVTGYSGTQARSPFPRNCTGEPGAQISSYQWASTVARKKKVARNSQRANQILELWSSAGKARRDSELRA